MLTCSVYSLCLVLALHVGNPVMEPAVLAKY